MDINQLKVHVFYEGSYIHGCILVLLIGVGYLLSALRSFFIADLARLFVRCSCPLGRILLGCQDFNFLPTNGFSMTPLKVKLLAGEQKATELQRSLCGGGCLAQFRFETQAALIREDLVPGGPGGQSHGSWDVLRALVADARLPRFAKKPTKHPTMVLGGSQPSK